MKRFLHVILMAGIISLLIACGVKDVQLKAKLEAGQRQCPVSLGQAGELSSMAYDQASHTAIFVLTLHNEFADVSRLHPNSESVRENMRLVLANGELRNLLDMLVEAEAGLNVIYRNPESDKDFSLSFTPAQLQDIAAKTIDNSNH